MIKKICSTEIYYDYIDLNVNNQIDKIIESVEFTQGDYSDDNNFYTSGYELGDGLDVVNAYKLEEIKKQIDFHFRKYTNIQREYDLESWFTLIENGYKAHVHDHVGDYSGVYYYHTNGKDGDIFFEHENQKYSIKPEVGKIILFPSWLKHGVQRNTTDFSRVSLAFNIKLKI